MALVHGTCVEMGNGGVLLRGPSGSGKSDLALRLIDRGGMLVSDDQVSLSLREARLWASAPPQIAGLLEVRGLGLVRLAAAPGAWLRLVVDLVADPGELARLPEPQEARLQGVALPHRRLAPFEPSAPAKLRLMMRALDEGLLLS